MVAGGYLGGLVASVSVEDLAPVDPGPLALALLGGFAMFLAVGCVTLLVASMERNGGRAVGWATGFLVISYAIDYLAQVWSVAEPLGPLSVFHYLDPARGAPHRLPRRGRRAGARRPRRGGDRRRPGAGGPEGPHSLSRGRRGRAGLSPGAPPG